MASWTDTLLSAPIGFVAGIVGSALTERLKASVAALEAELTRLDALQDKIGEVFAMPAQERMAGLRSINGLRRRVGINIRRLIVDPDRFALIGTLLSRLNKVIASAEDGARATPAAEAELDEIVRAIRRHVRESSVRSRAWKLLRGD